MKSKPLKASLNQIDEFLAEKNVAIVGISQAKQKFGNTIFAALQKAGYNLYPVHHQLKSFEGVDCYQQINSLPNHVNALIICTKPDHCMDLVKQAVDKNIQNIWLQQGAQNDEAILSAQKNGANIIHRECILMFAKPVTSIHRFHRGINKFFGLYPN
jgi:uncharacterized protein